MERILVIIEKGDNSYSVSSPDVPSCVAVGDTREEADHLMKEALREHLQKMREEHLPFLSLRPRRNIWRFRFQHNQPYVGYGVHAFS